uniref:Uncharacterized protein n=1 Tax=Romanomermis culicivorax TaxID=13658 RepID=A0A915IHL0_ROMCU
MVPWLDEEVALMATELINRIYDEAGLEIETIRYYELQFHSKAAGLAYTIAKAVLQDKKDPEPKYANIQVWKKETDNTDPRIRFWEVIDQKKAHDILEVEKSLRKKVGYRVKHAHNRPAASRVSKRWTNKDSDVRRKEKSQTPDKERKRKHESRH